MSGALGYARSWLGELGHTVNGFVESTSLDSKKEELSFKPKSGCYKTELTAFIDAITKHHSTGKLLHRLNKSVSKHETLDAELGKLANKVIRYCAHYHHPYYFVRHAINHICNALEKTKFKHCIPYLTTIVEQYEQAVEEAALENPDAFAAEFERLLMKEQV